MASDSHTWAGVSTSAGRLGGFCSGRVMPQQSQGWRTFSPAGPRRFRLKCHPRVSALDMAVAESACLPFCDGGHGFLSCGAGWASVLPPRCRCRIHSLIVKEPAKIAPSLLAADLAHLADEVARIEDHVDSLHIDVMDGHYVPNLSFGMPVIESLRKETDLYFDCHLMVTNPVSLFESLKEAGGSLVSCHMEVLPDPTAAAARARGLGLDFGLVINPATPFEAVAPFVELCDLLLVMSVVPGFGGQGFILEVLPKIEAARKWVDSHGLPADIEVDGGITLATAVRAREAGADVFVAGTAIFRAPDPVRAVADLRAAVGGE